MVPQGLQHLPITLTTLQWQRDAISSSKNISKDIIFCFFPTKNIRHSLNHLNSIKILIYSLMLSWLDRNVYFLIKIYYSLFSRITLCSSYTFRNFPNCFLVLSSSGSWPRSWMSRYLLYPLDNKSIIHWKVILLKNGAFVCLYTVLPRVSRSIKYLLLLLV